MTRQAWLGLGPPRMQELARGDYTDRAEPVILIGGCGIGKTRC